MARSSKGLKKSLKYLIIVDGQTEEEYLNIICQRYKVSAKEIKRITPCGANAILQGMSVATQYERTSKKEFEHYIIVIDRDDITNVDYNSILNDVNRYSNVRVIFSNISFEVWLLAHYKRMTHRPINVYSDRALLNKELELYLSSPYKKGDVKQLEQIINAAPDPIEYPYSNTLSIQHLEFDYQCTNLGPFLKDLIGIS